MQKAPPKSLNKTHGHGSRVWSIDMVTTGEAGELEGFGRLGDLAGLICPVGGLGAMQEQRGSVYPLPSRQMSTKDDFLLLQLMTTSFSRLWELEGKSSSVNWKIGGLVAYVAPLNSLSPPSLAQLPHGW